MLAADCKALADLLYPNTKDINYYYKKYSARPTKGEVTRLGPSPTGMLHIGQIYQSLINSLCAHKTGGIFYLRLEDTDMKREVDQAGEIAYQGLVNYGLKPDEGYAGEHPEIGDYGPYKQSNRLEIYHAFAHELVSRGRAFPCFCPPPKDKEEILSNRSKELEETDTLAVKDPCRDLTLAEIKQRLKEGKPWALRLRSNGTGEKTFKYKDVILGERELRENAKDDVLIKSNGIPVYSFAHVVDDTLMHTTTIVRGQDWYQSLPVHLELLNAFGFTPFKYAHTPNICTLDEEGNKRKISKRKDAFADVRFYLKKGYPVDAVIDYVMTLINSNFESWRDTHPDNPYTDFPFEMKKIGVANPFFDFMKLDFISKTKISRLTAQQVYDNALSWATEWDASALRILSANRENLVKVLSIDRGGVRPRKDISYYSEITSLYDYILPDFDPKFSFDLGQVERDALIQFLTDYRDGYIELEDNQTWFNNLKEIAGEHRFADNKTYKQNPTAYAGNVTDASKFVRLAITGKENSPELYSIMKILGTDEVKARLAKIITYIKSLPAQL